MLLVFKRQVLCAVLIALTAFSVWADEEKCATHATALLLGKRLFVDKRFSNPASNVAGTCYSCHRPQWAPEGKRAYCDSERYSLVPKHFGKSEKRTTLRNTPSLMDIGSQGRLNHDGRFASLGDAIAAELTSAHLGWSPSERGDALDEIHWVLLNDEGQDRSQILTGTYLEQFKRAYAVDLEAMTQEKALGWAVQCLAGYVRSLESTRTSAFDAFVTMNRLPAGPAKGETVQAFAKSLLARVARLEDRKALKIHPGFGRQAYSGLKIFMRTTGATKTGNCVACHSPPLFSDGVFHSTGVAQAEYDAAHGIGSFARLTIPNGAALRRPVEKFGPKLEKRQQVNADLGYWNYVQRIPVASNRHEDGTFLATALGAFKTPTLRNLGHSNPYMHNGAYTTLKEALGQKVRASALAKSGSLRGGDAGLLVMNISDEEIAPLNAFLATLDDLSTEEFENYRRRGKPLAGLD